MFNIPIQKTARHLKQNYELYQLALHHPKTPRLARILLKTALNYVHLMYDLIPDFIPILGRLDDALIVPGIIWLALQMIPNEVLEDARMRLMAKKKVRQSKKPRILRAKTKPKAKSKK